MIVPKLLAFKNKSKLIINNKSIAFRAFIIFALTGFLVFLTYYGTLSVLKLINSQPGYFYVPPSMPLASILTFLFYMLVFTNTISAIGTLYFSNELSLIISSPISGARFFLDKLIETLFSSSWMTIVFLLPVLFAFGVYYQAGINYYLLMFIMLVPYFLVPAALALVLATLSILLIPIRLRKEAMMISVCVFLYSIFYFLESSTSSLSPGKGFDASDLVKLVQTFSVNNNSLPSLFSLVLSNALAPQLLEADKMIVASFLQTLAAVSLSYLFLSYLYEFCYYRAILLYSNKKAKLGGVVSRVFSSYLSPKKHALIDKEIKVVARDLTQSVQLLMLLGICALYLYSLSVQSFFIEKSPPHLLQWWKSFFLVLNICVESFVITALSSRFAFSAVSREGRAFWIMQVAPVKMAEILKAKFLVWFVFIYIISALVFGSASWVYFKSLEITIVKIVSLIIINWGLVGLAIGAGAYFAKFDWDHISQVATSFGNLIYMLLAVLLVMFDVLMEFLFLITYPVIAIKASVFLLVLFVVNILVSFYARKIGISKLSSVS